jgi:hypothetical protein
MAISWDVKITPLNVARKEASITATRTDDTNPADIKTETIVIITTLLATTADKLAVVDNIWAHHLTYQAKQVAIAAYCGGLEAQAEANLMAREV